jgi:GTPase SAR1 family protein
MQQMIFDKTYKIILIGDSGVGKSCIIKRMGNNTFNKEHEVTIGTEFTTIGTTINQKTNLKL